LFFFLVWMTCEFLSHDIFTFQYVYSSIRVIVTMLSFFSKIVQYVYLCHNNCVSFYAFFMSLPNFSCSNFSTTQASSLVLHQFLAFSFSKLGLKLLKPSRQCLTGHLSTLSYMGVSSM
jgi:hypothetical protein